MKSTPAAAPDAGGTIVAPGPSTRETAAAPLQCVERLFDNGLDGVFAFDRDLRLIYWNPVMELATGIAKPQALGRDLLEVCPALGKGGEARRLKETLEGKSAISGDGACYLGEEEHAGTFERHLIPLHAQDGAIAGGVAILRDTMGYQGIAQRMRETEDRFRAMADCAPVLLWMSGTDSLCEFFNQGWLEFTGRPLEREIGVGWAEGVHPEDFQRCMDHYMSAFNARRPFEMVYRLRRADGEYRWILDHGAVRLTPDGAFAGYIGSCVDITDLKRTEETLKRTADDLARSNLELERFAYVASHDLQEPLRMVASFTGLLGERYAAALEPKAREYIDFAIEGATRMKGLIDGLLAFARIGRGEKPPLRDVDCSVLIGEVLTDLWVSVKEAGAKITWDPLPTVKGDRVYLGQLLRNLLANSIKFRAEELPCIHISASRSGSEWLFSVRDNGIGFDMKYAERIFGIFERLNPRERFTGNGIGLALCRRVVDVHGGRIWAESSPGAGSTFFFTLPAGRLPHP